MNYTTNYRIQKPIRTEKYDVNVYNTNADIIDSALNELEQKNVLQDELLATKKELNDSNKAIENEIQRATEKENEILDNINTNKTIWEDKYTREEIDDKLDDIVIPTKISELENDCNFNSGVKGIKGDNESEYHTEEYVNLTAENVGAIPVFTLENTGKNMINLDTLTDLGLYKIKNAGFDQVVAAGELIACNNLDLFVGGDKDYRYQILLTTGFSEATDNFKFREFYKNNDDSSQEYNISPWKELSGNKTITKADIGLGNVDNTADTEKYVLGIVDKNFPTKKYGFEFSDMIISNENFNEQMVYLDRDSNTIKLAQVSFSSFPQTEVKGNAETTYRKGKVNLTPENIGAVNKTGDTINGSLISSKTTVSHLAGNQGQAIINSTAPAGSYTMLDKLNSTNGYFTDGVYQGKRLLQYTAKSTVDAGTNTITKSATLLDESGNSSFPGTITASTFLGNFSSTGAVSLTNGYLPNLASGRSKLQGDGVWFTNPSDSTKQGWIRASTPGSGITEYEIAAGNSGGINERIYVRQYDSSGNVAHEITLLGYGGVSSFQKCYYNGEISNNTTREIKLDTGKLYLFYIAEISVSSISVGKIGTLSKGIIAVSGSSNYNTPKIETDSTEDTIHVSIKSSSNGIITITTPVSHRAVVSIYEISSI